MAAALALQFVAAQGIEGLDQYAEDILSEISTANDVDNLDRDLPIYSYRRSIQIKRPDVCGLKYQADSGESTYRVKTGPDSWVNVREADYVRCALVISKNKRGSNYELSLPYS